MSNQEQIILNSDFNICLASSELRKKFTEGGWGVKFYRCDKDRTSKQNALSHILYDFVSMAKKEDTTLGVKSYCKYYFGVPILIHDDPEMMGYFELVFTHLSIEDRIKAIKHIPVTSLMGVKLFARYLDNVYKHYEQDHGLILPRPDDLYFDALMKDKRND